MLGKKEPDGIVLDALFSMKIGAKMLKHKRNGKIYPRQFYLYNSEDVISYHNTKKLFKKPTSYFIKEIDEIRDGLRSNTFQRFLKRKTIRQKDETCAFTIMYDNHQKELHLTAPDQRIRDLWITGLKHLIERYSDSGQRNFISSDSSSNADDKMLSDESMRMNIDELKTFLKHAQHQHDITSDRAAKMIEQYEMNPELRNQHLLDIDGFRNLMSSEEFDLMKPLCAHRPYQDMTKPLTHYNINTSHNTYLFQSQVIGASNAEAYSRVLLKGGRAVELDCYDGPDGKPIVKHAWTLVSPCLFETIIHIIKLNCWKASEYPVILNIENHCSIPQQKEMARVLNAVLGEHLLTEALPTTNPSVLPSPEALKKKVLIRSRKISRPTKSTQTLQQEDEDDSPTNPLSEVMHPDFAQLLIYLQNVPFRGLEYARANYSCCQTSSLGESKFDDEVEKDPLGFIKQTQYRIIRTYPGGIRQDSSSHEHLNPRTYSSSIIYI
ncbi:unnamed protein product [Didymodactylos carnosus]|uniref:Phosphoinositide phospholipase C n=1 Tax=Didymodactylos carnosus TaxID=1234261 RepID=A0A815GJV2_9BILA|nr:unnamed protein product [Didymodactylos carnosus]CAF4199330.1 unnamed protein product [Didymodactylos carnosus]